MSEERTEYNIPVSQVTIQLPPLSEEADANRKRVIERWGVDGKIADMFEALDQAASAIKNVTENNDALRIANHEAYKRMGKLLAHIARMEPIVRAAIAYRDTFTSDVRGEAWYEACHKTRIDLFGAIAGYDKEGTKSVYEQFPIQNSVGSAD